MKTDQIVNRFLVTPPDVLITLTVTDPEPAAYESAEVVVRIDRAALQGRTLEQIESLSRTRALAVLGQEPAGP